MNAARMFSSKALPCWIAAAAMLHGAPARATEDAGTVSVFAVPMGPRGLAMGGAYAAAGHDATAWAWNPGTLALVERGEVLLGNTVPDLLDYREQWATTVLPSWRWGTLALGWRQFAVDGVEGRDERNTVTGDLSDHQSELCFGYGRTLGRAVGLGVSARWRRHELAERSANGLGADLGVVVRPGFLGAAPAAWLQDMTLGFSFQNLIRPAMRLDLEEVPDARSTRAALAWRPRLGWGLPVLFALDVEGTEGRSMRLRTGAELAVHRSLDMRVGMNGSSLAAGTGVRAGDLSLDYAFEDGPLAASHRLGVSFRFGASVEQSREAAARREQAELERRLAATFEARQRERTTALFEEATRARAAGHLDEALERLATLRAIEPDQQPAKELEAACWVDRARGVEAAGDTAAASVWYARALAVQPDNPTAAEGVERCREVSDRRARRSADLRKGFQAALEAFASDDLALARRGFQRILELNPEDAEARTMMERTRRAIESRVDQLLDQAERFAVAGLQPAARELIDRARALAPAEPRLARVEAVLARSAAPPSAARAGTPAAPAPPPLTASEQRDLERDYQRGIAALRQGRRDDAVRLLELVWERQRGHGETATVLKREYQARGMDAFAAGRLQDAIADWEKALRLDPNDARTRAYLARAREHLARSREYGDR